jgi:2-amino-4-hydroxy-6-hydroxymethyldihydropteridine diphosphokinase
LTDKRHQVFLGIGSNIEALRNIKSALQVLNVEHKNLSISETYQSAAVGFDGPPFLNLVVGFRTNLVLGQLSRELKQLERNHGRTEALKKFSSRTLDIDILTYDNLHGLHEGILLPRPEISYNAYVLLPFAELQPELILPGSNVRLIDLWHDLEKSLKKGLVKSLDENTDKSRDERLGKGQENSRDKSLKGWTREKSESLVKMSICW